MRQSSRLLRPYTPALDAEPFDAQQVVDAGDIACNPFDNGGAITQIHESARQLTQDGTRLLTIGGDHTIALPLLRAMHEKHGPVAVLHFDAHLDTWGTYFGEPYTHGTPFRRASEEGLIDLDHSSMSASGVGCTPRPMCPTANDWATPPCTASTWRCCPSCPRLRSGPLRSQLR